MQEESFGVILRNKRLGINMTLREFSRLANYDPSNISKIERGVAIPPATITLRNWARHLNIQKSTEEYQHFLDMGQIARNRIPDGTTADFRNKLLPAVLRTSRSKNLTREEFDKLVKLLNR